MAGSLRRAVYAVHASRQRYLKGAGLAAIWGDGFFLAGFSAFMLALGTALFKRTLK
jgi:hypothetical protein